MVRKRSSSVTSEESAHFGMKKENWKSSREKKNCAARLSKRSLDEVLHRPQRNCPFDPKNSRPIGVYNAPRRTGPCGAPANAESERESVCDPRRSERASTGLSFAILLRRCRPFR